MCFDYSALIGRIIEKYGNRYAFAYALGLSECSLSLKLVGEIQRLLRLANYYLYLKKKFKYIF